jgi:hypothetical protein
MSGKGSSTKATSAGSPPAARTDWRTVVSPMLLRLLMATVAPASPAASVMSLSLRTNTPPKSAPCSPTLVTPLPRVVRGRPCSRATMSEAMLLKPRSNSPLITPGTMAAPPDPASSCRSMPRSLKNPWSTPR